MNEWELTDAEIASAWNCDLRVQHLLFSGKRAEDVREGDRAIATTAQEKLVEWLNKHCFVYEGPCGKCGEDVYDDSVCCFRATDMAALGVK